MRVSEVNVIRHMDGQPSRRAVSEKFKTRRLEISCLLEREALRSMGIAQLRTIGRTNRRSEGREDGIVVSPTPSTSERNKPSSPVEKNCVPDEDCVISHIQPPLVRKRGPTDCAPLLVCNNPLPPLKIKRLKGHDGSVTYRVQRDGVTSSCSGVNSRGLNMRFWPRKWCMDRGSPPHLSTNSKKVSTPRSGVVVDLTGSHEAEGSCSSEGLCARTMEFRHAVARSLSMASVTPHNNGSSNPFSSGILIRSSAPGSVHSTTVCNRSLSSAVPSFLRNSVPTTLPTYSTISQSPTVSSSTVAFQLPSLTADSASTRTPCQVASMRGPLQQIAPREPHVHHPSNHSIFGSLPTGESNSTGLTSPRRPRITPPKPALPRTARVLNSSHSTELNHMQQTASTESIGKWVLAVSIVAQRGRG